VLSAPLPRHGEGFVANAIDYEDPPDTSCVVTRLVDGRTLPTLTMPDGHVEASSTVALFFAVDDCQGRPVTGLTTSDFALAEDGAGLSVESDRTVLPQRGVEVFISLVLDLSSSTTANLPGLIAGARSFVTGLQVDRNLPVHISIQVFAGEATLREWQPPTLDTQRLIARLGELATYVPEDPSSTNLYGAVAQSLTRQQAAKQAFEARNFEGVFTAGYVVVFTDGGDTAGRATLATVQAAQQGNPDSIVAVGLQSPDYDAAALQAMSSLVLTSLDPQSLALDFGDLAPRIAGQM
jgi:hypothetical protein